MAVPADKAMHIQVIYTPPNCEFPHVACLETNGDFKNWRLGDSLYRSISLKQVVLHVCDITPELLHEADNYSVSTINHIVSRRYSPNSIYEDRGPIRWLLEEEGEGITSVMGRVINPTNDEEEFVEIYTRFKQTTATSKAEHQRMVQTLRRSVTLTQQLPTPPPNQYFPPSGYCGPVSFTINNSSLVSGIPSGARPPTGTFQTSSRSISNVISNSISSTSASNTNEAARLGEEILGDETFGNTGDNINTAPQSRKRHREPLRVKVPTDSIDNDSSGETDTDEDLPSSHSAKLIRSSSSHSSVSMSPSPTNILIPGVIVTRN